MTALKNILKASIDIYFGRIGAPFPVSVSLEILPSKSFEATVEFKESTVAIEVTTGLIHAVESAWRDTLHLSDQMPPQLQIGQEGGLEQAVDSSLSWLLQHELNHYSIGHCHILTSMRLSETGPGRRLDLLQTAATCGFDCWGVSTDELPLVSLCLELQTDHDATEIVLGAYDPSAFETIRSRAIFIVLMMFLIEQQEAAQPVRTHPLPSTRLFMLLAHLVEMPMLPGLFRARDEGLAELPPDYFPNEAEMERYRSEVVAPVFAASQLIAEAIKLPKLWDQIGGADVFFEDINRILIDNADQPEAFVTVGAQEWARLKPLNDRLLRQLEDIRAEDPLL